MRRTGVPGLSVAVVHDDRVVYLKGFGLRRTGEAATVDPDTVFQLASLSKPVSSTVVAATLTDPAAWDAPLGDTLPGFALKDPWVTSHVTAADLFSHRSGLPDHAGEASKTSATTVRTSSATSASNPSPPSARATPTPTSASPPPPRPSPARTASAGRS
ncbi:serine hydrolase domain-containing protein [Streptomyces lavendulae]